jgi:septum formation protein
MAYNIPVVSKEFGRLVPRLILASQSPARRLLLEERGCSVEVKPTFCDESHGSLDPRIVVEDLSIRKLHTFLQLHGEPNEVVMCADTLIAFHGALIGKPSDINEAWIQLKNFSGCSHEVYSGYALYIPAGKNRQQKLFNGSDSAKVVFEDLSNTRIETYLKSEEWIGAAGSYRIQGKGNSLISTIVGDYCTVVGLPINKISAILDGLNT